MTRGTHWNSIGIIDDRPLLRERHGASRRRVARTADVRQWLPFLPLLVLTVMPVSLSADDAVRQPLSASVKILPARSEEPNAAMNQPVAMARRVSQPTMPDGRLPQYQLRSQQRSIAAGGRVNDAPLRFLVALPAQPVLLEVTITIDGEPYQSAREKRIREIITAATQPETIATTADDQGGLIESIKNAATQAVAAVIDSQKPNSGAGSDSQPNVESGNAETKTADTANTEKAANTEKTANDAASANDSVNIESENSPDANSDADTDAGTDSDAAAKLEEAEPEKKPVTQPTVAEYAMATTAVERVRRHIAATGNEITPDEVRWLLTNWVDGPALLMLNDNFQRFRGGQRPVFNVLDRDRDGIVSAEERELAVASFKECDLNRDDIVDYTELAKVSADPRLQSQPPTKTIGKLLYRVPDGISSAAMYRHLAARYALNTEADASLAVPRFDTNANGRFDPDELTAMTDATPDLAITVAFDTADPSKSRMEVSSAGAEFAAFVADAVVDETSVALPLAGTSVTFSAVQSEASDQISIGTVTDGYPILPTIDPNDDGRFTIRELRGLIESLNVFDLDHDGRLTADETPSPVRICFGLGPIVHRELEGIRTVNPSTTPVEPGPEWFVRMDRNKDSDVTRSEFPGTDDQFATLDADHDELISADEARDFEKTQQKESSS